MADVAFLFGWTPAAMERMELGELMHWRHRAVALHNAMHAPQQKS